MPAANQVAGREVRERAREAARLLRHCNLCPRRCGVDRLAGESGWCKTDARARCFREMLHFGVEVELVPAHAVYLAGCNMACDFCIARAPNRAPRAHPALDGPAFRRAVADRRREGAETLLLVGGEPTVSLPAALGLLAGLDPLPKVAWDSNMYFSPHVRTLLEGLVDTYVADLKFGNDRCADRVARTPDYRAVVTGNLRWAERSASLIVRHLLLPGHFECCFLPVLSWVKGELETPRLALHTGYLPPRSMTVEPALARHLAEAERRRALEEARAAGVELVP